MTIRISLFLLLWCCFAFQARPADSSTNSNEPVVTDATAKDITLAFGFYLGQILSLEAIEQKFPKLAAKAQIAKRQLETSYSPSIEKMDTFASSRGNGWGETKRELRNMIASKLADQALSLSSAEDFIDLAGKRAKGNIHSPIIETLLTFHPPYITNPHREFTDGFKVRFTSDGFGKAQGVRFHLDIPKSWSSVDDKSPIILRKFESQNGRGGAMIMVSVQPMRLPPGQKITEKDLEKIVAEVSTPQELKTMLPDGADFIAGGTIKLDNRPAYFQHYSLTGKSSGFTISSMVILYAVHYKTSVVRIHCQVAKESKEAGLKESFETFEPLFRLVANSLLIQKQGKPRAP